MGEAEKPRRRGDIMLNWAKKSGLGMATGRDFESTTGETDRETGELKARIGQASHRNNVRNNPTSGRYTVADAPSIYHRPASGAIGGNMVYGTWRKTQV